MNTVNRFKPTINILVNLTSVDGKVNACLMFFSNNYPVDLIDTVQKDNFKLWDFKVLDGSESHFDKFDLFDIANDRAAFQKIFNVIYRVWHKSQMLFHFLDSNENQKNLRNVFIDSLIGLDQSNWKYGLVYELVDISKDVFDKLLKSKRFYSEYTILNP